jgi:hypothetical protein
MVSCRSFSERPPAFASFAEPCSPSAPGDFGPLQAPTSVFARGHAPQRARGPLETLRFRRPFWGRTLHDRLVLHRRGPRPWSCLGGFKKRPVPFRGSLLRVRPHAGLLAVFGRSGNVPAPNRRGKSRRCQTPRQRWIAMSPRYPAAGRAASKACGQEIPHLSDEGLSAGCEIGLTVPGRGWKSRRDALSPDSDASTGWGAH